MRRTPQLFWCVSQEAERVPPLPSASVRVRFPIRSVSLDDPADSGRSLSRIPSILRPNEIKQILQVTRRDRSAHGRRDYAILTLLATYGLRAGEIVHLQLRDIDWRAETILIRHSKIRGTTLLPLVPAAGDALLSYLRSGRPTTTAREVFIRMSAPLQGFSRGKRPHVLLRRRIAAFSSGPSVNAQGRTFFLSSTHCRGVRYGDCSSM